MTKAERAAFDQRYGGVAGELAMLRAWIAKIRNETTDLITRSHAEQALAVRAFPPDHGTP